MTSRANGRGHQRERRKHSGTFLSGNVATLRRVNRRRINGRGRAGAAGPEIGGAAKVNLLGAFTAVLLLCTATAYGRELRVCADPKPSPFSNDKGEGFETRSPN
jgi:hypothetical protein